MVAQDGPSFHEGSDSDKHDSDVPDHSVEPIQLADVAMHGNTDCALQEPTFCLPFLQHVHSIQSFDATSKPFDVQPTLTFSDMPEHLLASQRFVAAVAHQSAKVYFNAILSASDEGELWEATKDTLRDHLGSSEAASLSSAYRSLGRFVQRAFNASETMPRRHLQFVFFTHLTRTVHGPDLPFRHLAYRHISMHKQSAADMRASLQSSRDSLQSCLMENYHCDTISKNAKQFTAPPQ